MKVSLPILQRLFDGVKISARKRVNAFMRLKGTMDVRRAIYGVTRTQEHNLEVYFGTTRGLKDMNICHVEPTV